jgi:hypothetical protein
MVNQLTQSDGKPRIQKHTSLPLGILGAAFATGLILFFASQVIDLVLNQKHIPRTATVVDNLIIGGLGGLLLAVFVSGICALQSRIEKAHRLALATELIHHIRNALTVVLYSSSLENEESRGQLVRSAIYRIERVLGAIVPLANGSESPSYSPDTHSLWEHSKNDAGGRAAGRSSGTR